MPQLPLFGASENLRQSQSPSNPKSTLTQSQSPQPQAKRIACYVIHQVAIQSEPEEANPVTFLDPDETCLKHHKLVSIPALDDNLCSITCGQVVALIRFVALSPKAQGGGQ
ncbi:hypothetical protein NDA01_24165 [Trichocoleus desertorum AS-A10]|uniref:hypothetical protein n=1 Tax=Trichocoleus desertorum TaxID=1481672 RepID=UPI0032980C7C